MTVIEGPTLMEIKLNALAKGCCIQYSEPTHQRQRF